VKLAAFGVLYNYTSTISKEIWTLNWQLGGMSFNVYLSNNYQYNLLDDWMIRHVSLNCVWTVSDCLVCTMFWL
jgi:hypothetical protein